MAFKRFGAIKLKILSIKPVIIFIFLSLVWTFWLGASYVFYKVLNVNKLKSPEGINILPDSGKFMMKYKAVIDTVQLVDSRSHYRENSVDTLNKATGGRKPERNTNAFYGVGCGLNPYRKRLQKLLKYWHKLVRHKKMEYFLCDGSLLGYQRTGDFIPYDHDIDICLNKKDYRRLVELESTYPVNITDKQPRLIVPKRFASEMRVNCEGVLVDTHIDPCSIISPAARVITGTTNFLDVYLYKIGEIFIPRPNRHFEKYDVYPTKTCVFAGIRTRCPKNPYAVLTKTYDEETIQNPSYVCNNHRFVAADKNAEKNDSTIWLVEKMNKIIKRRLRSKPLKM